LDYYDDIRVHIDTPPRGVNSGTSDGLGRRVGQDSPSTPPRGVNSGTSVGFGTPRGVNSGTSVGFGTPRGVNSGTSVGFGSRVGQDSPSTPPRGVNSGISDIDGDPRGVNSGISNDDGNDEETTVEATGSAEQHGPVANGTDSSEEGVTDDGVPPYWTEPPELYTAAPIADLYTKPLSNDALKRARELTQQDGNACPRMGASMALRSVLRVSEVPRGDGTSEPLLGVTGQARGAIVVNEARQA
jgi:hypothetical protein